MREINQESLFILAEVGNQFAGDLETAKRLALAAKYAGADAVKYIFWFPDEIMAEDREYSYDNKTESMMALLNRLRLTIHEWFEVKQYCDNHNIIMLTTVNSWSAYQWVLDLGLPAIKISSWDYNYPDLWRWCARTMLPCIADVGASTEAEMDRNVAIFNEERNRELMFVQCFHTGLYDQINMLNMPYIGKRYDCLTGYSAAGRDDYLDALSIGLGGCVLEKRLTLSRSGGVLHDSVSKEPDEFKEYVDTMRNLKKAMGKEALLMSDNDWAERKKWARRVVTDVAIAKGDNITRDMLECKRGETGYQPDRIWDMVGKTANKDMPRNYDIGECDVD